MHIKSIVAGAAIALVAGLGSVSAADQFSTLEGVSAEALSPSELASVQGAGVVVGTLTFADRFGTKNVSPDDSVPFTGTGSVTIVPGAGAEVTSSF